MTSALALPIALGIGSAFFFGTADYFSRGSSDRIGFYRTATYDCLLSLCTLTVLLPLFGKLPTIELAPVLIMIGASAAGFVGLNALYYALQHGQVSIVAPISNAYPAVAAVLSVVILGERLSLVEVLALVSIMLGVFLASTRFSDIRTYLQGKRQSSFAPGIIPAITCAFMAGILYLGLSATTPQLGPLLPVIILRVICVFMGFSLAPLLNQEVKPTRAVLNRPLLMVVLTETIGYVFLGFGLLGSGGAYAVVTTLTSLAGVFTVGYALTVLRERPSPNQIVGMLFTFGGIVAILYFTS